MLLILAATFRMYVFLNCERKLKGIVRYLGLEHLLYQCCSNPVWQADMGRSAALGEEVQMGRIKYFCTKVHSSEPSLESKGEKNVEPEDL